MLRRDAVLLNCQGRCLADSRGRSRDRDRLGCSYVGGRDRKRDLRLPFRHGYELRHLRCEWVAAHQVNGGPTQGRDRPERDGPGRSRAAGDLARRNGQ